MASWGYSIGNAARRAANPPAAVAPAVADSVLGLANLSNDYPDEQGALEWRSDGTYGIDFDLNQLASSSSKADAPTGWTDLLNLLAGTPGLPANPPDWGTYAARTALRMFRPVVQELDVMPGETVELKLDVYLPSGSAATAIRVRVVDLSTGKGWEGGSTDDWMTDGIVAEVSTTDAWTHVDAVMAADASRTTTTIYSVILEPVAASSYGATTYAYASAYGGSGTPAFFPEADLFAIVGSELPEGAVVEFQPQPSGSAVVVPVAQPSCFKVAGAAVLAQVWRLSVTMPAGSQPRPVIGCVWIGTARTMIVGSPILPIGGSQLAPGQISIESAKRRREIVADAARGKPTASVVSELSLQFRARDDASFRQIRDEIALLTRFGADPMLLIPDASFDGSGRLYHGRVGDTLAWSITDITGPGNLPVRTFALPFTESPFASANA